MMNLPIFITKLRSFMHIKKSSGPNTLPWGTPQVIVDIFELKPLIDTNCSDWSNMIQTIYLVFPCYFVICSDQQYQRTSF